MGKGVGNRGKYGHAYGVRVDGAAPRWFLRWTGPMGRRVRKFDGPSGRGLRYCRSAAMLIKSALRDWLFCVIWHEKHYVDQPPPVAFPPFGALRHQRGIAFSRPSGRLYGFSCCRKAAFILAPIRAPTTTLAPKGETTHYDLCVALLLQIMFAVHARGASNLSPLRTFGPKGRQPSSPIGACPYHAHEKTG